MTFCGAEDTLWSGSPGNYTNPEAPKALSEVRKLVSDGQYAEATKEAVRLSGKQSAVRCVFLFLFSGCILKITVSINMSISHFLSRRYFLDCSNEFLINL